MENDIVSPVQQEVLAEIAADLDNIRSGWGRAARQGNLEAIKKSQKCLWFYYLIRGWFQEGHEAFQKAVVPHHLPFHGSFGRFGKIAPFEI